jgi:hypothetical protein
MENADLMREGCHQGDLDLDLQMKLGQGILQCMSSNGAPIKLAPKTSVYTVGLRGSPKAMQRRHERQSKMVVYIHHRED